MSESIPLPPPRQAMRVATVAMGVALVAVAGIGGRAAWLSYYATERTDNAAVEAHIHPLAARIAATVTDIVVKDGDQVRTGQVLMRFDDEEQQLAVHAAEAALAMATARADAQRHGMDLARWETRMTAVRARGAQAEALAEREAAGAAVAEAAAGIDRAIRAAAEASISLGRSEESARNVAADVRAGGTAADDAAAATSALEIARARAAATQADRRRAEAAHRASQANLVRAQRRLESARAGAPPGAATAAGEAAVLDAGRASTAEVKVAAADLALARWRLGLTQLIAPRNGTVGRVATEVGARVRPDQTLLSLVGTERWVMANFKETQVGRLRPGDPATVELDGFPGRPLQGVLVGFTPATGGKFSLLPAENATGNFTRLVQRVPVRIDLQPLDADLAARVVPGMSARVRVLPGR